MTKILPGPRVISAQSRPVGLDDRRTKDDTVSSHIKNPHRDHREERRGGVKHYGEALPFQSIFVLPGGFSKEVQITVPEYSSRLL